MSTMQTSETKRIFIISDSLSILYDNYTLRKKKKIFALKCGISALNNQ